MNLRDLFKTVNDARELPAGTVIFSEGDPGDLMYVVLEGVVEIRVNLKATARMEPGDIFGEMALIDASPRSGCAVAVTDCRLAPINEKRFLYMVQQTPFFGLQVMRTLAHRIRKMNQV